jgi:phenylacetate-CoA ligase
VNTARTPWNPAAEQLSRDELQALQWQRLGSQLEYVYRNSPFYRGRLDALGMTPGDVRTWDHFRQIPTMDKHDHREAQEESMERFGHPFGMLACAPPEKFILLNATSGTTGTPTLYTVTAHDLAILNELQARKFWRVGLRPGDRVLHGYSLSMFVGGVPLVEALKSFGACPIPVGAEVGTRRLLDFGMLVRPRMLLCTPSYAEYLAEKAPEIIGRPVRELGIEMLMCGGEPGAGLAEVRRRIETAYGARLYDAIGATHTFHGVACDLPEYQGMHLVSEDYCILELLDPETKRVVDLRDGATGEMVFTYLDMEGTPFVRYALGDVLQVATSPCECGWPGLRFKILGRSDDMLIVKGVNVYPAAMRNVVVSFAPQTTGQIRVVLDRPGHRVTPPLRLIVEHGAEVTGGDLPKLKASIEQLMHEKLKVRPEIELVPAGTLERTTHKTKMIEVRSTSAPSMVAASEVAPAVATGRTTTSPVKEVNLVCMSGQGSVQTLEIMARAYYEQHGKYIGSVVFPGARSKSTPVVSYLKVSDRPIASMSTNFEPTEVIVFWEGLLRVAALDGHPVIVDAIRTLRRGTLIVNTSRTPDELTIDFDFDGTIATVDASGIARKHLKRNPPPVGVTLLGAYAAVTGALDLERLMALVRDRFPRSVAEPNVAAAREAYAAVRTRRRSHEHTNGARAQRHQPTPDELPEWYPIEKMPMRGFREGSPYIFRDKVPLCDDAKCLCKETCLSEALCPDNTGFIVRRGIEGALQGYRIDVDFCRGCGICVEVCVYGALRMVNEEETPRTHPDYAGITVAPYRTTRRS